MNIRKLLGNLIGFTLVKYWKLFSKFDYQNTILSIYFHNPSKKVFEDCVSFLKKQEFDFISEKELFEILQKKQKLKDRKAFISLDDAWLGNLDNVVPIVSRELVPITLFVPVEPLSDGVLWLKYFRDNTLIDKFKNKYPQLLQAPKQIPDSLRLEIFDDLKPQKNYQRELMTAKDVCTISKLPNVTIGSHTLTHPILPLCDKDRLKIELEDSKKLLETIVDYSVLSIAYPNGNFNETVMEQSALAGYKLAFTTAQKTLSIHEVNYFDLPRFCVPDNYGKYESIARMLGIWNFFLSK